MLKSLKVSKSDVPGWGNDICDFIDAFASENYVHISHSPIVLDVEDLC